LVLSLSGGFDTQSRVSFVVLSDVSLAHGEVMLSDLDRSGGSASADRTLARTGHKPLATASAVLNGNPDELAVLGSTV
jgi:hypothetical protein